MPEYIERDKLPVRTISIGGPMMPRFINVVYADDIKDAPSADVAPVRHGRWMHDHYENCSEHFEIVKCSCCGNTAYAIAFYVKSGNYCPNCGAKMDGGDCNA